MGSGEELLERVLALPGFGRDKARIFVGVLGKRLGVQPPGWEQVAADWASIADVDTYARVAEIREQKRARPPRRRRRRRQRPRPDPESGAAQSNGLLCTETLALVVEPSTVADSS